MLHREEWPALNVGLAVTVALLPWSWFPPFPWLHRHAQWGDVAFALTAILWLFERWRAREWPQFHPMHVAIALYAVAATLSLLFASPDKRTGVWKLLGICELGALTVVLGDLAVRPCVSRLISKVIVATSLVSFAAAIAGLALFYSGNVTHLIGTYGELAPSSWYARVQAGTYQPNMLTSFCIFASAVVARGEVDLSPRIRRLAQAALLLTVLLTFSRGILAFGLAAAIRLARTRPQRVLTVIGVSAYLAIVATLTLWSLSFNPAHPLETHFKNVPEGRREAAVSSLRTLAQHPLVGSGVGTVAGRNQGNEMDAHLTLLNVAATMGLPALLAFVWIFVALWRRRERPMSAASVAVWSGLAGLMLDGLAQDVEDFRHLWVMFGLAGVRCRREEASESASVYHAGQDRQDPCS